jgi:hypothetical protein
MGCAFSKHYPPESENYVIGVISDSVKLMAGWSFDGFLQCGRGSASLDLLLECIVLRNQLAVRQRTSTRRPCFRPSERLLWVLVSR